MGQWEITSAMRDSCWKRLSTVALMRKPLGDSKIFSVVQNRSISFEKLKSKAIEIVGIILKKQ